MNGNGMLVVVSAPSGCGKDTVFNKFIPLYCIGLEYEKKEMI